MNKKYKVICPLCYNEFYTFKSILMEMGINSGNCKCPKCEKTLHLVCDDKYNSMISEDYAIYIQRVFINENNKSNL